MPDLIWEKRRLTFWMYYSLLPILKIKQNSITNRWSCLQILHIRRVMNGSAAMIEQLNADLAQEDNQVVETEQSADNLAELLDELTEELKVTKRQRIREIMKHPENEASIEELYEEMETELQGKIDGLKHQIDLLSDRRNTIIEANRTAKTALEVFDDLLHKPILP